ncbi:MAG: hypothetical protein KAI71_02685 [Candidatus Pacebacteria bacterium]|nr:hypothetical protein [Candidatus Paceibacterota bacterium]
MENNGNFFNFTKEEIEEVIVRIFEEFAGTDVEIIRNQYLAHVEYWEGVLQKIKCNSLFIL